MINISVFGGVRPALHDPRLKGVFATVAHNTRLNNGQLRAFNIPTRVVADYHVGETDEIKHVHEFRSPDCCKITTFDKCVSIIDDVVSPGACGGFDYAVVYPDACNGVCDEPYWIEKCTGNTYPLILNAPTRAVTASLSTPSPKRGLTCGDCESTNAGPDERSYTYTWVDRFGVESPPAPPSALSLSYDEDVYTLSNFSTPPSGAVCIRIYRTGSFFEDDGERQAISFTSTYQLVDELPISVDTAGFAMPFGPFVDSRRACDMAYGTLLTDANCPPPCFCGATSTESGYVAGFTGSTLYMSERHEPWNFPEKNRIELPHKILGITAFFDFIFVATTGNPYRINTAFVARGTEADLTIDPAPFIEDYACLSGGTLVTTGFGAMYASHKGLVALAPTGPAKLISRDRIGEENFYALHAPARAAYVNGKYFGVQPSAQAGFIFDVPDGAEGALDFGDLVTADINFTQSCVTSAGRLLYVEDGGVFAWDEGDAPLIYKWRSKTFMSGGWAQMSAFKVLMDSHGTYAGGSGVTLRLYGDGRLLDDVDVTDPFPHRVRRSGRVIRYQIEIEGRVPVTHVQVAPSIAELSSFEG